MSLLGGRGSVQVEVQGALHVVPPEITVGQVLLILPSLFLLGGMLPQTVLWFCTLPSDLVRITWLILLRLSMTKGLTDVLSMVSRLSSGSGFHSWQMSGLPQEYVLPLLGPHVHPVSWGSDHRQTGGHLQERLR